MAIGMTGDGERRTDAGREVDPRFGSNEVCMQHSDRSFVVEQTIRIMGVGFRASECGEMNKYSL